ncbi:MAG TPA: hypothetical protein VND99_04335 [Candidatus Acidoferrales bacterium]|nr:hypothetical protein [Candidatus Acidoferrales bacterium]
MKIGFDLDKIFINTPPFVPISIINKFYKQRDNGILLYRIPSRAEQLILRKPSHHPFLRPPMKQNLSFLKELAKDKNNQLFLISSRFKFLEPETQRLINKYHLDKIFDKLYFNYDNKQPHEFKNDILKKLNLDIFVDDDLSLVRYVAKDNPQTKFFWLDEHTRPDKIGDNISAISNLADIFANTKNLIPNSK